MIKKQYATIAAIIYVVLSTISFVYHLTRMAQDKFSAVFITILALPWSFGVAIVKDTIIAAQFGYEIKGFGMCTLLLACVLVNTYLIFSLISKK